MNDIAKDFLRKHHISVYDASKASGLSAKFLKHDLSLPVSDWKLESVEALSDVSGIDLGILMNRLGEYIDKEMAINKKNN